MSQSSKRTDSHVKEVNLALHTHTYCMSQHISEGGSGFSRPTPNMAVCVCVCACGTTYIDTTNLCQTFLTVLNIWRLVYFVRSLKQPLLALNK